MSGCTCTATLGQHRAVPSLLLILICSFLPLPPLAGELPCAPHVILHLALQVHRF